MRSYAASIRYWVLVCALTLLTSTALASPAPSIQWGHCPPGADAGRSAAVMRCGVFEPGDAIGARPVRLHLTRLQVRPGGPTSHPVLYLPGGPGDAGGQSARALRAWRVFQQSAGWPRDLVIFDPRGTGASTPRPACARVGDASDRGAPGRCFKRLGRATAAKLGASAQVADLHRLVEALGQGSVAIWAESYGAVIARRLAAVHPDDVQLMILDSPVLRPQSIEQRQAAAYRRRRRQLVAACKHRPRCRLSVPSIEATIDGLIAARRRHSSMIAVADPPRRARTVRVDGDTVRALLMLSAYDERHDGRVLHHLRQALHEPTALSALAAPLLALDRRRDRRAPVYWSTRCQFAPAPSATLGQAADGFCRQWPVPRLAPMVKRTAIPTLVIAGTRDVFTPAATAAHATVAHPGWQFLPVDGAGHGVIAHSRCVQRWVAHFLARHGAWIGRPLCSGIAAR